MMGRGRAPSLGSGGRSVGQRIYVVINDVDSDFDRAQGAGAQIVFPPEDTEWGGRYYRVSIRGVRMELRRL